MKPASFRFSECCRHCQHLTARTMICNKHNFKLQLWDIRSTVCDDFFPDDEDEVDE